MFDSCGTNNSQKAREGYESDPVSKKVDDQQNKDIKEVHDTTRFSFDKLRKWFVHEWVDVSGNLRRKLLEDFGETGQNIIMKHDLILGATASGKQQIHRAQKEIFSKFTSDEYVDFAKFIESKRIISIAEHKRKIPKNPGDLTADEHQAKLNNLRKNNPEYYAKLEKASKEYFDIMQKQLAKLHRAGLITDDEFTDLSKGDYSPRHYIQYLDKEVHGFHGGNKITIMDSGLRALDEGSTRALEKDPKLLLGDVIIRTENRIARNEANKELHKFASTENDIVRHATNDEKLGSEEVDVFVMINGKPQRMAMEKEIASEWLVRDPALNEGTVKMLSWLSGAPILRATATGMNPEFALTNLPRDVFHAWFSVQEYSPFIPAAGGQMLKDFLDVGVDVVTFYKNPSGKVKRFIEQGGMMDFMTDQGRFIKDELDESGITKAYSRKGTSVIRKSWQHFQDVAALIGQKSELWTRMAVRERAIKNKVKQFKEKNNNREPSEKDLLQIETEATWVARNFLDFSQGGRLSKTIDKFVPYFNASIQGSRGVARQLKILGNDKATKKQKAHVWWKLANLGMFAMVGQMMLRFMDDDDEPSKKIKSHDRAANWIFPFPLTDPATGEKYYYKFAKDQSQRGFAAVFEALADMALGYDVNAETVKQAMKQSVPVDFYAFMPPTLKALYGYAMNLDFWRRKPIWNDKYSGPIKPEEEYHRGSDYMPDTHPAFIEFGKKTGLSPEKSRYALTQLIASNNTIADAVADGLRSMTSGDGLPDTLQEEVRKSPIGRRMKAVVSDSNIIEVKKLDEISVEVNTEQYIAKREIEHHANLYENATNKSDKQKIARKARDYIKTLPKPERINHFKKFMSNVKVNKQSPEITEKRWWSGLDRIDSPEEKANAFYHKWKGLDNDKEAQKELGRNLIKLDIPNERFSTQLLKNMNADGRM